MELTCSNCRFYRGRRTDPEQAFAAERAGLLPHGHCRRFPEIMPKHDSDWCGEHHPLNEGALAASGPGQLTMEAGQEKRLAAAAVLPRRRP